MKKILDANIKYLHRRFFFLIFVFFVAFIVLLSRMVYVSILDRGFLLTQGNSRYIRTINIPAYRGMILDRDGEPLAVSTPVDSVWMNPQDFVLSTDNIKKIDNNLGISGTELASLIQKNSSKQFVYLARNVNPDLSAKIKAFGIPGVYLEHNFKRFYPDSEAIAQVIGFTNIDDQGQEGLELAYNNWLQGEPGKEKVLQDRYGHVVAKISEIKAAKPGHDLTLSIDNKIQFLAYRVLKSTVQKYNAESGSVVVLNPQTGEILAMANLPSFNPNGRNYDDTGQLRNRAVTDMFEPGSTMKAFSIASAIDSGKYTPNSLLNTSPGYFYLDGKKIHDEWYNHGIISVTQVLQKSSNVGVAKMTLSLPAEHFLDLLDKFGFGERTQSGFPGESPGSFATHIRWKPFDLATLAFGYGITVTPLQLAHAYAVLADGGLKCPVTFLKEDTAPVCPRIISQKVASEMVTMLEAVEQEGGTGKRAKIPSYIVAGKTGTALIAGPNGYDKNSIMSSFVGIAPASNPQLVVAVIVRKPQGEHYGAIVAAPAFAKIMGGALRILNIPPDNVSG